MSIKENCVQYFDLIFPTFLYLIKHKPDLRELILHYLNKILTICPTKLQPQWFNELLHICLKLVTPTDDQQNVVQFKALQVIQTIAKYNSQSFNHKMQLITIHFNQILAQQSVHTQVLSIILSTYTILAEFIDPHLKIIIRLLINIAKRAVHISNVPGLQMIISFFNGIIQDCPSLLQQMPRVTDTLITLLDNFKELRRICLDLIINLAYVYKNDFVNYFPIINQVVLKNKIMHQRYQDCMSLFLSQGSLRDIDLVIENKLPQRAHQLNQAALYRNINVITPQFPTRTNDRDIILEIFDTSRCELQIDWLEWKRKVQLGLLKHGPSILLFECHSIAEIHLPMAEELFNLSFYCFWTIINDSQKDTIVKYITKAIESKTVPNSVLQMILNLAEFMNHDRDVLPIDISTLGNLAERCKAYAKALYYKEQEFDVAPESVSSSLMQIYTKIGHFDSAKGLIKYGQSAFSLQIPQIQLQKLLQLESTPPQINYIQDIDKQCNNIILDSQISGEKNQFLDQLEKMQKLNSTSNWDSLINECETWLTDNLKGSRSISDKNEEQKIHQVCQLGSEAAIHLGKWDQLEQFSPHLDNKYGDKNLFEAMVCINQDNNAKAQKLLALSRQEIDQRVTGLLNESYSRAYDTFLRLQVISELEEMIDYKEQQKKLLLKSDLIKDYHMSQRHDAVQKIVKQINDYDGSSTVNIQSLTNLKHSLVKKWDDRLLANRLGTDNWRKILAVRKLLLPMTENLKQWLKLSKMMAKGKQFNSAKGILSMVQQSLNKQLHNKTNLHFECAQKLSNISTQLKLTELDYNLQQGEIKFDTFEKNVHEILSEESKEEEGSLEFTQIKSKYYKKLGKLTKTNTSKLSEDVIKNVVKYFEKSLKFSNSENQYKVWHQLGLVNYESVQYYVEKADQVNETVIEQYALSALKSLIKAVTLSSKSPQIGQSKSFENLLRILTIWFKQGIQFQSIQTFIKENVNQIEQNLWIKVIPQLMAIFDVPNPYIQATIHKILKNLGRAHPHSIIYPLMVALKEKKSHPRRKAAQVILDDMRQHSPQLVEQAIIISEQLCKAALTLKEKWKDCIQDAATQYKNKNLGTMLKILYSMHNYMNENNQDTLNEISFQQSYGENLKEAEAWLKRFQHTKDNLCLRSAWSIYKEVFDAIDPAINSLETILLDNVSPKLTKINGLQVQIPCFYDPNRPNITISGFKNELKVLKSKQHPRQLIMYGSDGKEYQFLLKGHEDTRLDERAMQLFSLINKILGRQSDAKIRDMNVTRYSITPLSTSVGLLGWVQNSDTLQELIKFYRKDQKIVVGVENMLTAQRMNAYVQFQRGIPRDLFKEYGSQLNKSQKLEIFEYVQDNTRGEDLKNIFWLNSPNSEVWLERRTNYTKSLALMSMVGYILGLGDRHPGNIMINRQSAKIIHIDFGDSFEVAMKRDNFPEKMPFRLTRMMIKAMEAGKIEGTYRHTCEDVMRLLRESKDSLMAIMQAFVYDPLVNWKFMGSSQSLRLQSMDDDGSESDQSPTQFFKMAMGKIDEAPSLKEISNYSESKPKESFFMISQQQEEQQQMQINNTQILNKKAVEVVDRIRKKLTGRDFNEEVELDVQKQVDMLINQAINPKNLCQAYLGWAPMQ